MKTIIITININHRLTIITHSGVHQLVLHARNLPMLTVGPILSVIAEGQGLAGLLWLFNVGNWKITMLTMLLNAMKIGKSWRRIRIMSSYGERPIS